MWIIKLYRRYRVTTTTAVSSASQPATTSNTHINYSTRTQSQPASANSDGTIGQANIYYGQREVIRMRRRRWAYINFVCKLLARVTLAQAKRLSSDSILFVCRIYLSLCSFVFCIVCGRERAYRIAYIECAVHSQQSVSPAVLLRIECAPRVVTMQHANQ